MMALKKENDIFKHRNMRAFSRNVMVLDRKTAGCDSQFPIEVDLSISNHDFPIKKHDFRIKNHHVPIKNHHFLLKSTIFY